MNVKAVRNINHDNVEYVAGDVLEVSKEVSVILARSGAIETVKAPQPEEPSEEELARRQEQADRDRLAQGGN